MGKAVTVETQPVPRELLALFAKNHRVVKLLENLSSDVSTALPNSVEALLAMFEETLEAPVAPPVIVEAFPVGAIFTTTDSTNPAAVLGYGVWSAYAAGQVLVGYAAGDPDFGVPGGTGGTKTKAISAHAGAAVADHADHTHAVNSNVTAATGNFAAGAVPAVTSVTNNPVVSGGASVVLNHTVTQPNDHAALNVIQPYVTVYFWRRTA